MDTHTFQFVKRLLMDNNRSQRICIPIGNQTYYLNTNSLLYVKGDGHGTELHCLDRVISCSKTLRELKEMLSDDFYHIHRSYIINLNYLVSVCCYEAELINGIKIPIPTATYGKIKAELETQLQRSLKKNKGTKDGTSHTVGVIRLIYDAVGIFAKSFGDYVTFLILTIITIGNSLSLL